MAISAATTPGQILTSAYVNNNINSGLVYVTSVTVGSAVSTVAVTGAFNSTYDNYRIVYSGGTNSAASSLNMTLGASTTGYNSGMNYVTFNTGVSTSISDNNATKWGFVGYGTVSSVGATLDVINPFAAKYTTYHAAGWVGVTVAGISNGIHLVETSYTSFNIIPATGTLTGGTITVYGYRKA